jgi:hypothetical protein
MFEFCHDYFKNKVQGMGMDIATETDTYTDIERKQTRTRTQSRTLYLDNFNEQLANKKSVESVKL